MVKLKRTLFLKLNQVWNTSCDKLIRLNFLFSLWSEMIRVLFFFGSSKTLNHERFSIVPWFFLYGRCLNVFQFVRFMIFKNHLRHKLFTVFKNGIIQNYATFCLLIDRAKIEKCVSDIFLFKRKIIKRSTGIAGVVACSILFHTLPF